MGSDSFRRDRIGDLFGYGYFAFPETPPPRADQSAFRFEREYARGQAPPSTRGDTADWMRARPTHQSPQRFARSVESLPRASRADTPSHPTFRDDSTEYLSPGASMRWGRANPALRVSFAIGSLPLAIFAYRGIIRTTMRKSTRRAAFVYLLRCADGTIYTGWTFDVARRVREHQQGRGARYTRARRPVELIYHERLPSRRAAMRREVQVKRMSRKRKLALAER